MIQTGDWVKIHYTGRLQENGKVFDTTEEDVAKEEGILQSRKYGPFTMCVGEGHIIKGIDKALIGKNIGDKFTIKLTPEEAFGKKNPKLLQLISKSKFSKNNINPQPGLRVNVDNQEGTIKSISGGRVIVDFNHPLAGKDVEYDIKVESMVDDDKEKIEGYLTLLFQQPIPFDLDGGNVKLKIPLPQEMINIIQPELKRLLDKEIKLLNPEPKKNNSQEQKEQKEDEPKKSLNNQEESEN